MLYEAFEKQPQAKKEFILQVAIEEFAKNGYEKTSTDVITSRAGISKGLLFHYFKSKKNLYLYLVSYVSERLTEKTLAVIDHIQSNDFFERIKEAVLLKQQALSPYKQEAQFLMDVFLHPPKAVAAEIEELLQQQSAEYGAEFIQNRLYPAELIVEKKLRPGMTKERVIQMTAFVVEQMSAKYQLLQQNKQYDFLEDPGLFMKELGDYLEIVEHGVYE
ncbi:TetR/AcrR family transcriptional regulator [Bacillus badius]|uniref:Transcriptional regulator, TetR family n=1 Tax=Bacillus badius TaxID=1455 RepID=A0ABR5AX46_BACBA|nr:TetR/AcrR family transcriptional regulator [Bacillus badius]KIL79295.1 Transcriptional regulator, TetR family [Bacillus badius]KZR59758.1 TetR family transcriptional regulator [Bacillus badius]MED4716483.1 TetR/AcrR family transcriptional regulator [Bacillus badius]